MRISIWDLDWYHKYSFIPNYKAQKISSFHKQKGDLINFIEEESQISFDYDLLYIFKEMSVTPMPPSKFIDNKKVKLVGKIFNFYDNYYELDLVTDMLRPDYLLYDVPERNAYANAHVLKLLHGTTFLAARQNHINEHVKYSQKTLVVDEQLWETTDEVLEKCLLEIKKYKNIAFLNQISLKRIFNNTNIRKIFTELHFSSGTIMKFKNDYGSDYIKVLNIIDFMENIKENSPNVALKGFPVKSVILNHWKDMTNGIKDLERVLKIMDYAKKKKIKVILKSPTERLVTPYWYFFDLLETWSQNYYQISYIESMLSSRTVKTKEQWHEIINNPSKWSTPRSIFLVNLIAKYPQIILKYGIRQWGDSCIDILWIDPKSIAKAKLKDERDDLIKILEEEISGGDLK